MTKQELKDILVNVKADRRLLAKVPDKQGVRSNIDRRAGNKQQDDFHKIMEADYAGRRYLVDYAVTLCYENSGINEKMKVRGIDISSSGMLLEMDESSGGKLQQQMEVQLRFEISPGSMPEGYEMKVDIKATVVRLVRRADGKVHCGVFFKKRWRSMLEGKNTAISLSYRRCACFLLSVSFC